MNDPVGHISYTVHESEGGCMGDGWLIFLWSLYKIIIRKMQDRPSRIELFNLSSLQRLPDINHSLKLINTINVIPNHPSMDNVDLPLNSPLDSLAERISPLHTAAGSAKKRRIGCTCKKTFCLKMYCQCFASGKQCGQDCACANCKNTQGFEEVILIAKSGAKQGRNCSLAEKRCNCKKSHCLKRYCECFNAGVGCSEGCKCQGCENKGQQEREKPGPQGEVQSLVRESVEQSLQEGLSAGRRVLQLRGQTLQQAFPSMNGYKSIDDLSRFYN